MNNKPNCVSNFNIRDFGALPDGTTLATRAIQAAIDECHNNGGGTVSVPPGEYLTGTIWLKDNVTFFLENGAIIRGSADKKDYDTSFDRTFLIGGFKLKNVAITGMGVFHGNGEAFWVKEKPSHCNYQKYPIYAKKEFRPFSLIQFRESEHIIVSGITIVDSACYALWTLGCDNVRIGGITINNNHSGPNTDGLDIDCSANVTISDCNITTGDDSIALKSDTHALGYDKACENILVTNCKLSSSTNAIRIGFEGDGEIKNCVFTNLSIHDSRGGICFDVIRILNLVAPPSIIHIEHGARISNMIFQDIVMDVQKAIHFWVGIETPGELKGFIKNILIKDVIARAERGCNIDGHSAAPIEGLVLENITLSLHGEKDESFVSEIPHPLCVWGTYVTRGMPDGFFCRHMKDLTFRNVSVRWEKISGPWSSAIRCEKTDGLVISGFSGRQAYLDSDQPVIQLRSVTNALITGALVREQSSCFVRIHGDSSRNIRITGNDLIGLGGQIAVLDGSVGKSEVTLDGNRLKKINLIMKQILTPSDLSRSSPGSDNIWDNLWRRTSIGRPAVMIAPSAKTIDAVKARYDFEIQDPDCLPSKWTPKWREALIDALVGIRAAQEMPGDYYPAIPVPRFVHRQGQGMADIFGVVVESQPDGNEFPWPLKPDPGAIRDIDPKPLESSSYWQAVEWIRYARQATGGLLPFRMPVMGGPIDMANYVLGTTVLMEWIYTEPDTLHSLLEKITNVTVGMLKAIKEASCGMTCPHHFKCVRGGFDLGSEVRSLISKEMYADFDAPYLRRIGEACGSYGIHSCGNWERTVASALSDPCLVAMNGQSKENDLAILCRLADGKILLSINSSANLHERFLWKTREEFLRHVIETVPPTQPFETIIAEEELPFWLDCCRKVRGKHFDLPAPVCIK